MEAAPARLAALGPISPELALVDPDLARRARELLPEPRERPRPPAPATPLPEPEIQPARRRRLAQTLVLAALIFAAGAASGTIMAPRHSGSGGATLEFRAAAPVARPRPMRQPTGRRTTKPSSRVPAAWASNVLGLVTRTSGRRVVLFWHRPASSTHVVVLRARGRGRSSAVYRGRATRYVDSSLRPCATYRYTLVTYDRRGRRSTGVSSSVVTPGCA